MSNAQVRRGLIRAWPWLLLAMATLPSFWYVLVYPSDVDPEFPGVVRPTFSAFPPAAYRWAEPGDTTDHIAVYTAASSIVLCVWGVLRAQAKRGWIAALALSLAAYWHAATPGPLLDGWHGLGWRVMFDPRAATWLRLLAAALAVSLAVVAAWGLAGRSLQMLWKSAGENGTRGLFITAAILLALRQLSWIDREPLGFWPRWVYVWGLLAWAFALVQLVPKAWPGWTGRTVVPAMVLAWLLLDFTGRGLFWYQRPLRRLREVVAGRVYISAMPSYWGLELAQERHHFRTIINLFPEYTDERSADLPDELRFAREHGITYVSNEPGDNEGEAFIARTLALAREPSCWPVLVHCHASMDRSPAWMGLYRFVVGEWQLSDALREIEHHRGLRPKASVILLYNRVLPALAPVRSALDPTAALLKWCARGTVDPMIEIANRRAESASGRGGDRSAIEPYRR
jgi:predicted protein tyrosine phosphatase